MCAAAHGGRITVVTATRVITARAGGNESDTVLIEGVSPNFHDVVGAEFRDGRPIAEIESRAYAQVAVLGASVARALFGPATAVATGGFAPAAPAAPPELARGAPPAIRSSGKPTTTIPPISL